MGQISNEEVSDYFRQQSYLKVIDLLWTRMELSDTPLSIHTSKDQFTRDILAIMEQEYTANKRIQKVIEDHEEEELIAKARREIAQ